MYVRNPKEINWIKNRLHQNANTPKFDTKQKKHILHKLNQSCGLNFCILKHLKQTFCSQSYNRLFLIVSRLYLT